jgi:hypothetical protein
VSTSVGSTMGVKYLTPYGQPSHGGDTKIHALAARCDRRFFSFLFFSTCVFFGLGGLVLC